MPGSKSRPNGKENSKDRAVVAAVDSVGGRHLEVVICHGGHGGSEEDRVGDEGGTFVETTDNLRGSASCTPINWTR